MFQRSITSGSPLSRPSYFSTKEELVLTCPILGGIVPTAASESDRPYAQSLCVVDSRKTCFQQSLDGETRAKCNVEAVTTCKEVCVQARFCKSEYNGNSLGKLVVRTHARSVYNPFGRLCCYPHCIAPTRLGFDLSPEEWCLSPKLDKSNADAESCSCN